MLQKFKKNKGLVHLKLLAVEHISTTAPIAYNAE